MSFTRVNPGSWAIGDPLTSAQQNQLDIDHANALDKTTAGDTISGIVTFSGAGKILTAGGDQIIGNASGGIASNITAGIVVTVASGLQTNAAGGILLAGGSTDWIQYNTLRTFTYMQGLGTANLNSAFTQVNEYLSGLATTVNPATIPLTRPYHQAFLFSATLFFAIGSSHGSLPAFKPQFGVFARPISSAVGATPPIAALSMHSNTGSYSGGYLPYTAANPTAYFNGGIVQSLVFTPDQNNQIDNTTYNYFISLIDESGSGSFSGNLFFGVELLFTVISNSQPG